MSNELQVAGLIKRSRDVLHTPLKIDIKLCARETCPRENGERLSY